MVDVEKEAKRIISEPMADKTRVREIKSLCATVREEERNRCAEMVKGSLAHFEAADRISDQILSAPSPGSGPVQKENE